MKDNYIAFDMKHLSNVTTIFLDFDGVLHPADYLHFKTINGELILSKDVRFCWAEVLLGLIRNFDCYLVIHSSWRMSYTLNEIRNLLPMDLGKRVIAATTGDDRYESILSIVEKYKVNNYVILDDAADEFPIDCQELILCNGETGINCPEIQSKLVTILGQFSR